jgi:uncharacterized protein (TIGR00251 family)
MRKLEAKFGDAKQGAAITVKVSPRAKHTEFTGVMDDGTLKFRVAAVPEDGAANAALVAYLAEIFHIPQNQIEVVVGASSEKKLISLVGVSPAMVEETVARLAQSLEDDKAEKPEKKKTGKLGTGQLGKKK